MEKKIVTATSHMQATYLKERIDLANRKGSKAIREFGKLPETAQIKAAQALLKKFEKDNWASQERAQKAAMAKLSAATTKVRQDVLFGDPAAALKVVIEYEKHVASKYASD